MTDSRPDTSLEKIILRTRDGLRTRLNAAARENGRSANAEAVKALEAWLAHDPEVEPAFVRLPERLRELVVAAARVQGRSVLDEIAARIEDSFKPVGPRHVEGAELDLRTEIRDGLHEALQGLLADPARLRQLGLAPPKRPDSDEPVSG